MTRAASGGPPAPPILRSPPFPHVAAAVAAISRVAPDDAAAPPPPAASLVDAVRAARVGGCFWARAGAIPDGAVLIRAESEAEARSLAARFAGRDAVALLPDAPWARAARDALTPKGIMTLIGAVDPWSLLDRAGHLHAPGDDELALLALIAGVPVACTTPGRFAGHGLTDDAPGIPPGPTLTLEALARAALAGGVAYRDPFSGAATDAFAAVARLADWRRLIDANRPIAVAAGIAFWKRREVGQLLWNGHAPLRFARTTTRALRIAGGRDGVSRGGIAGWPSRLPKDLPAAAAARGTPLIRVEDGFVRSVGLGSNLHPPLSIVADADGIYYDPSRPSDLETLLATTAFAPDLLDRVLRLAETIVAAGISKYSSGHVAFAANAPPGVRRVLVAGQVEDDESVRTGGGGVAGNRDLLARARAAEPDAFILFKPHPDVDAGHRAGRIDDADALTLADRVVRDVPMPALLDAVDGVHVLTSLTGFEALLRGRDVTVHGSPFYAGWGLTRDLAPPLPRRGRALSLAELAAATLILYPRYLDPVTGLPCPPEVLVDRLAAQRRPRRSLLIRARRAQGWLRGAIGPIGKAQ